LNRSKIYQNKNEALLVLGASGFLGKNLVTSLKDYCVDKQLFVSQRSQIGAIIIRDYPKLKEYSITSILDQYQSLTIVNLISGRMQSKTISFETHFSSPRKIFDQLILHSEKRIHWVQIESYSQYASDNAHDIYYVSSKNLFHWYLADSLTNNISTEFLVLGHLSGPGDLQERFLPKTYRKILKNENFIVTNSHEKIPLIDVRDVARYLSLKLNKSQLSNGDVAVQTFPIKEIPTVLQIIQRVKEISGSTSQISEVRDLNRRFIERFIPEEQPYALNTDFKLRTNNETITDTINFMKSTENV
jgi:nucleoside-diphosphate-sugar epimerase